MIRQATYAEGNAGIWSIICADCPLLFHAEALDQPAPKCLSGIATNMQGQIVLHQCKHTAPNKVANDDDGGLTLECGFTP